MKDYYRILGLERNATAEAVKAAYLRLAKKFHPDVNPDCKDWAAGMFKEVGEAYSILGDGAKRVQYDGLRAGPRVVQMPPQSVATVNVNGQEISGALAELLLALMQQSRDVVRRNPSFVEILAEKMGLVKRRRKVKRAS
jgi:curved DNA-binding protein CbpA